MDPFPLELEYRLTFGDRVVWWGRPGRLAIAGRRDRAVLPVIAIGAITAAVVAFAPGSTWHPVVATIFRLAFATSGAALIATHLAIVVRQRRRRFYAIARDRVLIGNDFWSGDFRAVPLDRITDATVDAGPSGDGTITLIVDDGTRPRLADVADAQGVRTTLLAARAHFRGRMTVSCRSRSSIPSSLTSACCGGDGRSRAWMSSATRGCEGSSFWARSTSPFRGPWPELRAASGRR